MAGNERIPEFEVDSDTQADVFSEERDKDRLAQPKNNFLRCGSEDGTSRRRHSFLCSDSETEDDEDDLFGKEIHDTVTPFAKIQLVLQSLVAHMPDDGRKPKSAAARSATLPAKAQGRKKGTYEQHINHRTPPLDRLLWCIDSLASLAEHSQSHMATHEKIINSLKNKLEKTTLMGGNDADVARWVETHYTEDALHLAPNQTISRLGTLRKVSKSVSEENTTSNPTHPHKFQSYYRLVSSEKQISDLPLLLGVNELLEGHDSKTLETKNSKGELVGKGEVMKLTEKRKVQLKALFVETKQESTEASRARYKSMDPLLPDPIIPRSQRTSSAPVINLRSSQDFDTDRLSQKCQSHLENLNNWGLDIFRLDDLSHGMPLSAISMAILQKRGLIVKLGLDGPTLQRYFSSVEDGYSRYPHILYHNNVHAADVTHSTHVLMNNPVLSEAFSDLEVYAAILAAAAHDVGHLGVTNPFLIATRNPLATLYNDQSVLENHHAATAFNLMYQPGHDVLRSLGQEDQEYVRRMIIAMILSTDMAKHFTFLSEFRTMVETKRTRGASTMCDLTDATYDEKVLTLCAVVHCADLGASTKPWESCKEWCHRIMHEFFRQGDNEAELNLEIGPLHNRTTTSIPKAQTGFIDFIVHPLFETWEGLDGEESIALKNLADNRARWQMLVDAEEAAKAHVNHSPVASKGTSAEGIHIDGLNLDFDIDEEEGDAWEEESAISADPIVYHVGAGLEIGQMEEEDLEEEDDEGELVETTQHTSVI